MSWLLNRLFATAQANPMLAVFDVNVLISAVISERGISAELLRRWERSDFKLVTSPAILEELIRVIHYSRIQEKYNLDEEKVRVFLTALRTHALVAKPSLDLEVIHQDPDDNRYLECAIATGAHTIVSGDHHLLDLEEHEGIVILNPAGFLAFLEIAPRMQAR